MNHETRDGELKAGAATLVDSSRQPARAKKTRGGSGAGSPKAPKKTGYSGPKRGIRGLKRVLPSKGNGPDKQQNFEVLEGDANEIPEFWRDVLMGVLTVSSSEDVNDPRLLAMADIELMRAELQVNFFNTYTVLDEKSVNDQAGCETAGNKSMAKRWRSEGRIIGVPFVGTIVYPAFQFQSNGEPIPLILEVNKTLPKDCTDWQRAAWFVSPNEWLDGEIPVSAIQRGDLEVVNAASHAFEVPIG